MVNRHQAVRRGTYMAARLHRQMNSRVRIEETGARIDVFEAIVRSGISLFFRPLKTLLGVYMPDPMPGIMITTNRQLSVQRYTAAHEFGHFQMRHRPSLDNGRVLARNPFLERANYEQQEIEADVFASEFLIPLWALAIHFKRHGWSSKNMLKPSAVYQLSLRLGVSYEATCRALYRHKVIELNSMLDLLKIKPRSIKEELLQDYQPASWRNDVWLLTERDEGAIISGSRGDLFILKLREHSNAGYLWNFDMLDRSGFTIVRDEYEATHKDLIGGEVNRLVVAESNNALNGNLHVEERRPWELQDQPSATFMVSYDLSGPEREGISRIIREQQLVTT